MKQWTGLFGARNVLNDQGYPYEIAHKILENHNWKVPNGYWHDEKETGTFTINILITLYSCFEIG